MELRWDTKEKEHINILKQTTWKAVLATDSSYAIVVDHNDTRKKKDICTQNFPDIDYEKKDWFTILFSPKGIICDLQFMNGEPAKKQQMLHCMQNFRQIFFISSIEQKTEEKDLILAEAIRRLWKSYGGNAVMGPLSKDDHEVQKLLNSVKNQNENHIGDFEAGIYDLIIKYSMQLVLYERSYGPKALKNLGRHELPNKCHKSEQYLQRENETSGETIPYKHLESEKLLERKFKKYNEQYVNMDEILERTKAIHSDIYEELKLGDIEEATQVFFYPSNKCPGRANVDEFRKMQVTILGLIEIFLYYYAFDICRNHKKPLMEFSLGECPISEAKEYYADISWVIIDKTSMSAEIVLYALLQLNRGLEGKKDCEFQTVQFIFDRLQVRLLPYLRVKSIENLTKTDEFNIVWEKLARSMWEKLQATDCYSLLGQCVFQHKKNAKLEARRYWKKRVRHIGKKKDLLQEQLTTKENLIVDRFQNFFSVQHKNLNTWDSNQTKRYRDNVFEYIVKKEKKG